MEEGSSADGPIGEDLPNNQGENPPFQRQRPNPPILFNTYLLEAFKVAEQLRDSQCTDDIMILNQSVSEHYCESNKTVYSFMNGIYTDTSLCLQVYRWGGGNPNQVIGTIFIITKFLKSFLTPLCFYRITRGPASPVYTIQLVLSHFIA